jgi:hypothetical protein
MMKNMISVVAVVVAGSSVFAGALSIPTQTQMLQVNKMIGDIDTKIKSAQTVDSQLQDNLIKAHKDLVDAGCKPTKENADWDCKGANPAVMPSTAKMKSDYAYVMSMIKSMDGQLNELHKQQQPLLKQVALDKENQGLATNLQNDTLWLLHDFEQTRDQTQEIGKSLDEVEKVIDKSRLGVYMQDKVGLLLSSDAFCNAQKRCQGNPAERKELDTSYLKEVFPEIGSAKRTGTQYYDKAKANLKSK